jgi:hypothetical protein
VAAQQAPPEIEEPATAVHAAGPQKPRLASAIGVIVKVGKRGIAVAKPGQERPTLVLLQPDTRIRLDRQLVELDALQPGDRVAALGDLSPRGAIVARGIRAHR